MGVAVRRYKVTEACYVPVGPGFKYKKPGQVVTLHDDDAAELTGYITPVAEPSGPTWTERFPTFTPKPDVAKRNTEEVTSDASEPVPADERAGSEVNQ